MSSDKVELIRTAFEEAIARGGDSEVLDALDDRALEAVFARLDPDVEFHEDASFPEAGVYRGLDAVRGYIANFRESFDELQLRAEDFVDVGHGRVLVLFELITRGQGSGARIESRPGWIFEIRDGAVIRIDAWLDRDTALREAGVEGEP